MSVVASDIVFVPSASYRPEPAVVHPPGRAAAGARVSHEEERGQRVSAAVSGTPTRNTRVKKVRHSG